MSSITIWIPFLVGFSVYADQINGKIADLNSLSLARPGADHAVLFAMLAASTTMAVIQIMDRCERIMQSQKTLRQQIESIAKAQSDFETQFGYIDKKVDCIEDQVGRLFDAHLARLEERARIRSGL